MAKFRYVGDREREIIGPDGTKRTILPENPPFVVVYGQRLDLNGSPAEIGGTLHLSADQVAAQLRKNRHFEEVSGGGLGAQSGAGAGDTGGASVQAAKPASSEKAPAKKRGPGRPRKVVDEPAAT